MLTSRYANTPLEELITLAEQDKDSLAWAIADKYAEKVEELEEEHTCEVNLANSEGFKEGYSDGYDAGYDNAEAADRSE